MARKKSFLASAVQLHQQHQREQERRSKALLRQQEAIRKSEIAAQRSAERAARAAGKEKEALRVQARKDQTVVLQTRMTNRVQQLSSILADELERSNRFSVDGLKRDFGSIDFDRPEIREAPEPPDLERFQVPPLGPLAQAFPSRVKKWEAEQHQAMEKYREATSEWQRSYSEYELEVNAAKTRLALAHEQQKEEVRAHNKEIDDFVERICAGDHEAVVRYFQTVLESSLWPVGFSPEFAISYDSAEKLIGIGCFLPDVDIVPKAIDYRYVKTRDEIVEKARPARSLRDLYLSIVSQSALRVLHEIAAGNGFGLVETLTLDCYVRSVDKATGQNVRPCLVSVRTSPEAINALDLSRVDPAECLKGLKAVVSAKPTELVPVRPIMRLDAIDHRFVQAEEVISELETRPNLLDYSPYEFEHLVTNLFKAIGLEVHQARASRDGGVDCVAYDMTAIFGGKFVIQAKRYEKTVGVSAVRDLYGTMQNEGASKGILVTTSQYGKASYEFADGKPIELVNGPNLLSLLQEHTEFDACILPKSSGPIVPDPVQEPSRPGTSPQDNPYPQPFNPRP